MDEELTSSRAAKRRRISGSSLTDSTKDVIREPNYVEINVSGAYIVEKDAAEIAALESVNSSFCNTRSTSPVNDITEPLFEHDRRDIRLPNHSTIVTHVGLDIGGSLAKVVYFTPEATGGGRIHFLRFETNQIDACIDFIRELQIQQRSRAKILGGFGAEDIRLYVIATGGGAFMYHDKLKEKLEVEVTKEDEMECLIKGLDFFITEIPREVFTYDHDKTHDRLIYLDDQPDVYPYLLVNIGSGVSMIKVDGPARFQRIGGTSLGGGTFWGLLSLLTGSRTFDDMLALAEKGENSGVDLLVGDIYGPGLGYEKVGLSEKTIASSFGKVLKRKRKAEQDAEDGHVGIEDDEESSRAVIAEPDENGLGSEKVSPIEAGRLFRAEDIARSLLYAVR